MPASSGSKPTYGSTGAAGTCLRPLAGPTPSTAISSASKRPFLSTQIAARSRPTSRSGTSRAIGWSWRPSSAFRVGRPMSGLWGALAFSSRASTSLSKTACSQRRATARSSATTPGGSSMSAFVTRCRTSGSRSPHGSAISQTRSTERPVQDSGTFRAAVAVGDPRTYGLTTTLLF